MVHRVRDLHAGHIINQLSTEGSCARRQLSDLYLHAAGAALAARGTNMLTTVSLDALRTVIGGKAFSSFGGYDNWLTKSKRGEQYQHFLVLNSLGMVNYGAHGEWGRAYADFMNKNKQPDAAEISWRGTRQDNTPRANVTPKGV